MSGFYRATVKLVLTFLGTLALTACLNYSLTGAGGFPSDVRTVFIAPLGNETVQFDLEQLLFRALTERLPRSLGVRLAGENAAHAIVRGTVTRYENAAQNYRPGAGTGNVEVLQHQIQITMSVQIVDVKRNEILYEGTITGRGEYRPDTQSEDIARTRAIELLIQQIVDGAQKQW